jgi:HlyD family secretion protein
MSDYDNILVKCEAEGAVMDDQGTIKFEIKTAVAVQDDLFLRAGYNANADIVLDRREQVLAINEGNLITEDGKTFVEVETGPQEFEKVESNAS